MRREFSTPSGGGYIGCEKSCEKCDAEALLGEPGGRMGPARGTGPIGGGGGGERALPPLKGGGDRKLPPLKGGGPLKKSSSPRHDMTQCIVSIVSVSATRVGCCCTDTQATATKRYSASVNRVAQLLLLYGCISHWRPRDPLL